MTLTFGTSLEYQAGANVERAWVNFEQALTSSFGTSPEYRAGANVEPALTSTFGTSPEYRAGVNVEPFAPAQYPGFLPNVDIRACLTFAQELMSNIRPSSIFGNFAECRCQSSLDISRMSMSKHAKYLPQLNIRDLSRMMMLQLTRHSPLIDIRTSAECRCQTWLDIRYRLIFGSFAEC
ncbi:hypothetical protein DPMN_131194 [Dreissena polymorpha]|uniref:Uncharacterized protein n=1 Tax=Dreissena polymorpha TaxID=45954 RepID=A0A9D4H458_DREPO|nr:hypothetical protein DPMN_131194 [Dreissena polymorpha]